jgi:hypothetical protein
MLLALFPLRVPETGPALVTAQVPPRMLLLPKYPPPRGGVPQNIQRASPAPRGDATHKLSESDRVAILAVLKSIPHDTKLDFNLTDSFCDEKLIHYGTILDTLIGNYIGDQWDFLIIGTDERVLEFHSDTEVVLGIVSLGPVGACMGTVGADALPFQQVLPGEVRTFLTPCNKGTFLVSPCAIVFGTSKQTTRAVPVTGLPDCAGDGTLKVYDRILVEGCCNPDSVMWEHKGV